MSFGDHLEELRRCLIRALVGLSVAVVLCFMFGDHLIELLTTPYKVAMEQAGFDPRMVQLNPTETFVEYFKVATKFGILFSSPWILYQLWSFVATGLYPTERRMVKFFAPTSIGLFVVGAGFMLVAVLTGLMKFLIGVSLWFPLPGDDTFLTRLLTPTPAVTTTAIADDAPPFHVPVLADNPAQPEEGQVWINARRHELSAFHDGERYVVSLRKAASSQFVQPFFSISEYLDFVVNLGLAFGFGFQIPIVVVCIISLRLISAAQIASARKFVILAVSIAAAILTPSPDPSTMMLLAVPMWLLFEIGLLIGRIVERRDAANPDSAGTAS